MQCVNIVSKKWKGKIITYPCGKCAACLSNRRQEWTARLIIEDKHSQSSNFLTITYDERHKPTVLYKPPNEESFLLGTLSKDHIQLFLKSLRRKQERYELREKLPHWKIRYFIAGEYGSKTLRPHYHAIMFNVRRHIIQDIASVWKKGSIDVGTVTPQSISYTAKYIISKDDILEELPGLPDNFQKAFALMSKGYTRDGKMHTPPLGCQYVESHKEYHIRSKDIKVNAAGSTYAMPKIYKKKIFGINSQTIINNELQQKNDFRIKTREKELKKMGYKSPFKSREEQDRENYEKIKSKAKANTKL